MTTYTPPAEAVEAAARAMADDWNPDRDPILSAMFRDYALSALTAAGPLIERAVREKVAQKIEARVIRSYRDDCSLDEGDQRWNIAIEHAASLARGEGS